MQIIDFNKTDFETNVEKINNTYDENIIGYNLTKQQLDDILIRCKYVKFNEIGKTISLYNKCFIRSKERVGIICDDESKLKLMEETFEMLVFLRIKGRRIKLFKGVDRLKDMYSCDALINISSKDIDFKNIKVVEYTNLEDSTKEIYKLIIG